MLCDDDEDRPTFPDDPAVQHENLARLLLRLEQLACADAEGRGICELLSALLGNAALHFAAEEHAMERAEYPDLEEHRNRHAKLMRHIEQLRSECEARGGKLSPAIAEQLQKWFDDHEQTADAEMLSFLGIAP
jgi:hemerythrin-like metal-binding protein